MIEREFFIYFGPLDIWLGRDAIWITPAMGADILKPHPAWDSLKEARVPGETYVEINDDGLVYLDIMKDESQDDGMRFGVHRLCLIKDFIPLALESYQGGLDRIRKDQ